MFYLKDYEFREESIRCIMTKTRKPNEKTIVVWVERRPKQIFIGRRYFLSNLELPKSSDSLLQIGEPTHFADDMILI
jgi:hypothetical protein